MARYIDGDKLLEKAEEIEWFNEGTGFYDRIVIVHKYDVETAPTADVVPKSEVEMLQGALKAEERHNELTMEMAKKALANARAEVAREIFEDIENFIPRFKVGYFSYMSLTDGIAELKKKYTEEALK